MVEIPDERVPLPAAREGLIRLVDSLTRDTTFRMAHWGVLIMDPEVADTIVSINAGKLFMPASNQKLVTGAAALELLGADYRWRTPVLLRGTVRGGTFRGDLVLMGSGDPSWSDSLQAGGALSALTPIADALAARGVRRIAGRVLVEGEAFPDAAAGFGWGWDDLDFGYSAGVDDLMLNENFFTVTVHGGARAGAPATVRVTPDIGYPRLRITATTRARSDSATARREPLTVASDSTATVLEVRGTIAAGDSSVIERAYRHPNSAALAALRHVLASRGITVTRRRRGAGERAHRHAARARVAAAHRRAAAHAEALAEPDRRGALPHHGARAHRHRIGGQRPRRRGAAAAHVGDHGRGGRGARRQRPVAP